MKNTSFDENYSWANEYIVLFESDNHLILLERNQILGIEHIIMTTSLLLNGAAIEKKHWCTMANYHHLLPHKQKIKRFQKQQDNFKLFKLFFNLSVDEFFEQIQVVEKTPENNLSQR